MKLFTRSIRDWIILLALICVVTGVVMILQSQRDVDYKRGYQQALADQQTYLSKHSAPPSYSWFIQAETHYKDLR